MRMTLVAEVAAAYFRLVALDNELSIVRRTLITRGEGVYQARLRFEGGLTSETVFQQAKVEYATTASLIPELERSIETTENGISLLMGEYPDWRVKRAKMDIEAKMRDSIPIGIPSELLQRRPDVRAVEQQLRAAMAAVGVAYADRFPRLTFRLEGGVENNSVSEIFRSPFSYVIGSLASPVFGFGRKKAKYRAALAAYDEARLAYEKKVLEVFREANDAVVTYRKARETAALRRQHQLHRRTGRPAPLLRRPDRPEQRRARRAPRARAALQVARRRLADRRISPAAPVQPTKPSPCGGGFAFRGKIAERVRFFGAGNHFFVIFAER